MTLNWFYDAKGRGDENNSSSFIIITVAMMCGYDENKHSSFIIITVDICQ